MLTNLSRSLPHRANRHLKSQLLLKQFLNLISCWSSHIPVTEWPPHFCTAIMILAVQMLVIIKVSVKLTGGWRTKPPKPPWGEVSPKGWGHLFMLLINEKTLCCQARGKVSRRPELYWGVRRPFPGREPGHQLCPSEQARQTHGPEQLLWDVERVETAGLGSSAL